MSDQTIGIFYRSDYPQEGLIPFSKRAADLGFDELWVAEDCLYGGGIAQAGVALASTDRLAVGIGIMPAVVRNPVFTAMQIASLSRIFPGRFLPGIGHGVRDWMRQIGQLPGSQLGALEEHAAAIRALLHGENVTTFGDYVNLDDVKLVFPPDPAPPLYLGVRGPKSLQLAGRVADGTITANGTSPAYIRWAREQIEIGRQSANHTQPHRLTAAIFLSLDTDIALAKQRARDYAAWSLAYAGNHAYSDAMGLTEDVQAMIEERGYDAYAAEFPDDWLRQLAAAGTLDDCLTSIQAFADAGPDSILLYPLADVEQALTDKTGDLIKLLK